MLGKSYVNGGWFLCKFEKGNLYILKTLCSKPFIFHEEINIPPNLIIGFFEDGQILYFDASSSIEINLASEFYHSIYENINYFKSTGLYPDYSFNKASKISLTGGIVSTMLQLMEPTSVDIQYNSKDIKISFNKTQEKNNDSCVLGYGTLMLESEKLYTKYSIDIEFEETNDFKFVINTIYKVYNFLKLFNCNDSPCLQQIEIRTNNFTLNYFDTNINYNCSKIGNYNLIVNIKDNLAKFLQYFFINPYKFDFLNLLNKNELNFNDTNILTEAIESIAPQYDRNLDDCISREIKMYEKLKETLKSTINQFETNNKFKIDTQKRTFILKLVELSRFRQKIEYLLFCYNKFADTYQQYIKLTNKQIQNISKNMQKERNNIHGINEVETPQGYIYEVQYVLFGLILHICFECSLSFSEIFNLYDNVFKNRLHQQKINKL